MMRADMQVSTLCFRIAVLTGLAGMVWGMAMAGSGDHATLPAHAHLNLLGWLALFAAGVFYRLHPALDRSRLALLQTILWVLATLVMTVGVALIYSGRPDAGEPLAGIGGAVLVADMLLFVALVWRSTAAPAA
ncbi:hypothetical protein [Ferrovibrio sp.]|uniref:hypothetical protein n=2 Tax=Ferrovibrio sp. TaxID=1917215 RepID=UPI0035123173